MLARALIVLFSLLNLGVAAWWIAHEPAPASTPIEVLPGVARLQLVSETGGTLRPAAAPTIAQPAASAPAQCFSFGPFAPAQAAAAVAKLQPLVQRVDRREELPAGATARGWRVFLPPLATREQAQATAQRIGAAGFTDYLVVREGAEANSIALGRYRNEQGARSRAASLEAAGFAARVEPVGVTDGATVWLDVVATASFDPRATQALIAAAQYRSIVCATPG